MEEPKCKICGDMGRAKPTLSEPDGEECECTKEPGIMADDPNVMRGSCVYAIVSEIKAANGYIRDIKAIYVNEIDADAECNKLIDGATYKYENYQVKKFTVI